MEWRSTAEMPRPTGLLGAAARNAAWTEDPEGAARTLRAEIIALTGPALGAALEDALRRIAAHAALTDAVLQVRAVHGLPPRIVPGETLAALARDLYGAGFRVCFAPMMAPAPGDGVPLGMRGAERELREFVESHPEWELPERGIA
ncbi:MAG TPA: hypothetical protein VFJ72_00595 [Rubrobacteraceae bacterium]|nr:hypothetical protein [Rubrobacteraceae bacterium]